MTLADQQRPEQSPPQSFRGRVTSRRPSNPPCFPFLFFGRWPSTVVKPGKVWIPSSTISPCKKAFSRVAFLHKGKNDETSRTVAFCSETIRSVLSCAVIAHTLAMDAAAPPAAGCAGPESERVRARAGRAETAHSRYSSAKGGRPTRLEAAQARC